MVYFNECSMDVHVYCPFIDLVAFDIGDVSIYNQISYLIKDCKWSHLAFNTFRKMSHVTLMK